MNFLNRMQKIILFPLSLLIFSSCMKQHSLEITPITSGNVIFTFTHSVNGEGLQFDTMIYSTSLGNRYMVNDLQYFVSRFSLHQVNGRWVGIKADDGIHYTDARNSVSCAWWPHDAIPSGTYDTISFILGLDVNQNITGRFPDPPQRDMFWPDMLGGGYHYMKLNLKWMNNSMTQPLPFDFHLGIGQIYPPNSINPDSILGFVQNYFPLFLPCKIEVSNGGVQQINIMMKVDRWFDGESAFDFSAYPNGIMMNQDAMFRACVNGRKAFTVANWIK